MGDIFSSLGTAMQAGGAPTPSDGSTMGNVGSALQQAMNQAPPPPQAQQFDPNYGIQQRPRTFGEFIQTMLQSIR